MPATKISACITQEPMTAIRRLTSAAQLANKSNADLFISVHNNSTGSGRMSSTNGTQVMYDETSEASKNFGRDLPGRGNRSDWKP